jgi:hypothetical protein
LHEQVPLDQLADDQGALDAELGQLQRAGAPSREERRQWVEGLSADGKAELAAKANRFRALSPAPEAQRQLVDLERDMARADDAAELQQTMLAYVQWLAHRPAGEQAELRQLSISDRLARIEDLVRREDHLAAQQLSPGDAVRLRKEVLAIAEDRRADFEKFVEQRRGRDHGDLPRRIDPRWIAWWAIIHDWRDEQSRDAMRERLTSHLSPAAKSTLQSLRRRQDEQLMRWVRESLSPKPGPEELEQFFATQLDIEERARLLSLPAAEMQEELEQSYIEQELGLPRMQWRDVFSAPGRFGRGLRGPDDRPRDRARRDGPPPNGSPRGDMDRGPIGPPPLDGPGPDRQPPPDRQLPDRRPPPSDHQQEPI